MCGNRVNYQSPEDLKLTCKLLGPSPESSYSERLYLMSWVNCRPPASSRSSHSFSYPCVVQEAPLPNHWYVCPSSFFLNPCSTYHFICVYPLISICLLVTSDLKQFRLCMANTWKFDVSR